MDYDYNYAALERPLTHEERVRYKQRIPVPTKTFQFKVIDRFSSIIVVVVWIFMTLVLVVAGQLLAAACIGVVMALGYMTIMAAGLYYQHRRMRLLAFAEANSLSVRIDQEEPPYKGIIFEQGSPRIIREAVVLADSAEIGTYQYKIGSEQKSSTYAWTYMRVKLPRKLPHMLLDSQKNNSLGTNIANFAKSQTMKLEGNFNDYFTVYVPDTYQTDALYLFTPDVMAILVEYATDFDIEVIDDSLVFYRIGRRDITNVKEMKKMITVLHKVSSEIRHQGERYADTRVMGGRERNVVAQPGKRLRVRGVSVVSMIFLGLAALVYCVFTLADIVLK